MTFVRRAMKKNRGVAVILAIFFMMLLSLIGVALIGIVPVELRSATRNKLDLQAHYAATSGIRHAKEWCSAVMTPVTASESTPNALGDPIGIGVGTSGNSFYPSGGAFHNEITGVNGTSTDVEYTPMRLEDLWASGLIPSSVTRWSNVYQMLNIPQGGANTVHGKTVVLVKKTPLTMGNWSVYTVIVPDQNSPGGINTLDAADNYLIKGSFGGSGQAGRRAYQIISLGYYQGYPTIRAKSTILEDSFARYSLFVDQDPSGTWALQATKGEITTQGPVHTNEFFRFALNSNVWDADNSVVPFNGLMTHAQQAAVPYVDAAFVGKDGNRYYGGNDAIGTSQDKRPFDNNGAELGDRYNKLMGGKGNLRRTGSVSLPPDSTKIANAAYGTNYQISHYGTGAVADHFKAGTTPDGLFVFPNSSGRAAGGIVVKNDQRRMFLEVVDQNGVPIVNQSALEAGTATGNPAIRVQAKTSQTSTVAGTTITGTSISTGTTTSTTRITTGSTTFSTSRWVTITTGTSTGTSLSTRTLYSTSTGTSISVSTRTLFSTSTRTVTGTSLSSSIVTRITLTTGYTTIGGAGGVVQPLTSVSTSWTTSTRTTTSTSLSTISTGTSLSTTTRTTSQTISTGTSVSTATTTRPLTTRTRTTFLTTRPLTSISTSTGFGTTTITSTTVTGGETHSWYPIDQVIEAKNVGVNISPTMFRHNITASSANYTRAAGAIGNGNDMDAASLAAIETMYQLNNGTLTPIASGLNVGTNNIVLIKQSRENPREAIVTVIPATPDQEGKLLNGAVLTEGNIGDPTTGGLAGVNMGRRTIGGQIDANGSATENPGDATNFGSRPNKDSTFVGIGNNVWQFGTRLVETDPHQLRADNGLGLVAEDVRINANPNDFSAWDGTSTINFGTSSLLNLHMVILAGSNTVGGLTVKGFQTLDDLTTGNMGAPMNQTPVIRFMGGLILRNYYPRINGVNGAGWNSKNIYNQQLALVPPPYFPNNGLLIPLSYVEERIWGEQRY